MSEHFLRRMGFCGVDDSVSPQLLCAVSKCYPWIEWGVLFRSDLEGTPRYPTRNWVNSLFKCKSEMSAPLHMAAHLCRDRCQQVIDGDDSFVREIVELGFERAQINATIANGVIVENSKLASYVTNIKTIARSNPRLEFIFQFNDETKPIWDHMGDDIPANISILYDASCGKGVEIQTFPSPSTYPSVRCGYAGGIGPLNIGKVLQGVKEATKAAEFPVWIDMESSLRTFVCKKVGEEQKDEFSIQSCMVCVVAGLEVGLPCIA